MAKKTAATAGEPALIRVRYDLHELPTAQHKAGLAGLLLQVESMGERGFPADSIPHVQETGPTTVEALFTEQSLRATFNDLYDAIAINRKRRRGASSTESAEDRELVGPRGRFFETYWSDGKEIWLELWRDTMIAVVRDRYQSQRVFRDRLAGMPAGPAEGAWSGLMAYDESENTGGHATTSVKGSTLVGAQEKNAETLKFTDRCDRALLLHFWQLAVRIFVPEQVDADDKRKFVGYVLAIPEVADLRKFIRLYKRALGQVDPKPSGYRPRDAVISLPQQGALEFMDSLARLVGQATSAEVDDVTHALSGVEFFHMVKAGNNVKTMSHGRLAAHADLLRRYEAIRQTCRNPLFLSGGLLALLRDERWYEEFGSLMAERPWRLFVQNQRTPRNLPPFARDARGRFETMLTEQQLRTDISERKAGGMTQADVRPQHRLEALVYRLVRNYVRTKTEMKCGITYKSFQDRKVKDDKGRERVDYPESYVDAREKVCSDLFLGFRSRREEEFVSYFTGTIGSVPQGSNLSAEDNFRLVAEALLDPERWQDVKTLAMLAASASSYKPRDRRDDRTSNDKESDQ